MTLKLSFGTTLALDVILTVLHTVAIGSTIFRVYHRARTRRLWWDDFIAAFSMLADTVYICVLWFAYASRGSLLQTHKSLLARYWLSSIFFFLVIWCGALASPVISWRRALRLKLRTARTSLALTIARIFPPKDPTRRFAIGLALLSTILCLVAIIQSATICSKRLTVSPAPVCQWPTALRAVVTVGEFSVSDFIFNVLSHISASISCDALLVITPLYKLWRVRLPRNQRRLILICFTASTLTTLATVSCAIFQFAPSSWEPAKSVLRGKINYLEAMCNFLVVVTYLYRLCRRGDDLDMPAGHPPAAGFDVHPSTPTTSPSQTTASCSTRYTLTEVVETAYTSANAALETTLPAMRLTSDVASGVCRDS
ncbi:hypothetical protein CVT26_006088 [Gymnopilus dilepis]|uniref:G-protein coupled receptors family 1 profile domain-containing protein n=1 Tax=Gymnopilus dilepis TaxID=231916 RepID=A0A409VQE6_9AGAR|nr:hypothetical protein CVT26_006088 [Gymnopilus dilepis]